MSTTYTKSKKSFLDLGIIQYPLSTSLFEATGSYESVTGYKIVISNTSSYEMFNSNKFTLLQNVPNPSNGNTIIKFLTSIEYDSIRSSIIFGQRQVSPKPLNYIPQSYIKSHA